MINLNKVFSRQQLKKIFFLILLLLFIFVTLFTLMDAARTYTGTCCDGRLSWPGLSGPPKCSSCSFLHFWVSESELSLFMILLFVTSPVWAPIILVILIYLYYPTIKDSIKITNDYYTDRLPNKYKKIFIIIIIIILCAVAYKFYNNDSWRGFYYQKGCSTCQGNYIREGYIYGPIFDDKASCLAWAEETKQYENNPSYYKLQLINQDLIFKCGFKCKSTDTTNKIYKCKKIIDY